MIIEFKMSNVKSYNDEVCFTLLAPKSKVRERYSDNYKDEYGYSVLKSAIIVGENAGGKSNFIQGLKHFQELFTSTDMAYTKKYSLFSKNILNFKSIDEAIEKTLQTYGITITSKEGYIYKYNLELTKYGIKSEKLEFKKNYKDKWNTLFECVCKYTYSENDESNMKREGKIKILNNQEVEKIMSTLIESNTSTISPNGGLIVTSLSMLGIDLATFFVQEIKNIHIEKNNLDIPIGINYKLEMNKSSFNIDTLKTKEYFDIFKMVDSSIKRILIDDDKPFDDSIIVRQFENGREVKRRIGSDSTGVNDFFVLALLIYDVIYNKKTIFADEMDATLNPILTARIISYIHSFEDTGQFIFTTHNIFNLNFQIFTKEQMFIVSKDKETLESKLYSLSTFNNLRYDANNKIYELYLKGLLGGVGDERY